MDSPMDKIREAVTLPAHSRAFMSAGFWACCRADVFVWSGGWLVGVGLSVGEATPRALRYPGRG